MKQTSPEEDRCEQSEHRNPVRRHNIRRKAANVLPLARDNRGKACFSGVCEYVFWTTVNSNNKLNMLGETKKNNEENFIG
jgi:hypothetical protein